MTEFGRVITQNEHNLHNGNFRLIGYENLCVQPLLQHFFQKRVFGQMK